ncbi:hypothetical protein ACQ29_gp215 [Escherichia phage PBECO4]|uniref:Uncharacterized protein n=1 Tax=Escherichia phage PBECO4 TaxID=1273738 RepID=L7TPM4_9CAUD|nr:hypothetical protein ACQ29_gp215 [Escherichia phage PBECO4]AGC34895.1 hypothetical protein [Escherichia phage PBECO4]
MRIITQQDILKFTRVHASEFDAILSKSYNNPYTQDVHYSELWMYILLGTNKQEQAVQKYLTALRDATANGVHV